MEERQTCGWALSGIYPNASEDLINLLSVSLQIRVMRYRAGAISTSFLTCLAMTQGLMTKPASAYMPEHLTFLDWCQNHESLSAAARHTVEVLLQHQHTEDCFVAAAALEDINYLRLAENQNISDLGPLSSLTRLTHLDLSTQQIRDLVPLSRLIHLQELRLNNNQVTDLGPLVTLDNLQTLEAINNQLSNLESLAEMYQLQTLKLGRNQIVDITPLADLPELEIVNLYDNQIADIQALAPRSDRQLRYLELGFNDIEDISPLASYERLTPDQSPGPLESLGLTYNRVTDISALTILPYVRFLNLSYNPIDDLSPLPDIEGIAILTLGGEQLRLWEATPPEFERMSSLSHLSLAELEPTLLPLLVQQLSELRLLTGLELPRSNLVDVNPLTSLDQLTWLDLRHNQLQDLSPLGQLPQLSYLNLENNQLQDLSTLTPSSHLNSLFLANNHISDLTSLRTFTQLSSLDLRHNPIVTVGPLASLDQLQSVNLAETPLYANAPCFVQPEPSHVAGMESFFDATLSLPSEEASSGDTLELVPSDTGPCYSLLPEDWRYFLL